MPNVSMSIFRKDPSNVGDWWSPPHIYFDLNPRAVRDLVHVSDDFSTRGICIVGGGGLGREGFRKHLRHIKNKTNTVIGWGVGSDLASYNPLEYKNSSNSSLLGDYFDNFDLVGTRVWDPMGTHKWVPCASAMHHLFEDYYDRAGDVDVVIYSHKRLKIEKKTPLNFFKKNRKFINIEKNISIISLDNDGNDIASKIKTLSRARVVLTNSYHGVYWATLLNKKVICIPFKSGLYSFRHRPHYTNGHISFDDLSEAPNYVEALSECRKANMDFYDDIMKKWG